MSSYLNFYLRLNDTFVSIGNYSSNNFIYQIFKGYVPYEHISALTVNKINEIINDIKEEINSVKELQQKDKDTINLIMDAKNTSIDEKLHVVTEYKDTIAERDDYIENLKNTIRTLEVYYDMICEYHWYNEQNFTNKHNEYIYAGIEASGNLESIV